MKKIILTAILCIGALASNAQNDEWITMAFPDTSLSKFSIHIGGGFGNNTHVVDMLYARDMRFHPLSGKSAMMGMQWHPKGWVSLVGEVAYVQKNYMMYREGYKVNNVQTKTMNDYLSVPIMAQFSIGGNFRAFANMGGYCGYWLKSHRSGFTMSMNNIIYGETTADSFDEDVVFDETKDNRFDAGLCYGLGLAATIAKKVDLSFEARCYYGLTDIQKQYMTFLNPRYNTTWMFQFAVGYRL